MDDFRLTVRGLQRHQEKLARQQNLIKSDSALTRVAMETIVSYDRRTGVLSRNDHYLHSDVNAVGGLHTVSPPGHGPISHNEIQRQHNADAHTHRQTIGIAGLTEMVISEVPAGKTYHGALAQTIVHEEQLRLYQDKGKTHRALSAPTEPVELRCLLGCGCRCHSRSVLRSPYNVSVIMGHLFVAYANLPWSFSALRECDEQTCRRSAKTRADVNYFWPAWSTSATATFTFNFRVPWTPVWVTVQTHSTIPYDSPILVCVQAGNISGVRQLLSSGRASLNDVDPYGLGLMYYATYYCTRATNRNIALETSKALLEMGAHADWEDEIGNTPAETMIEEVLMETAMTLDRPFTLSLKNMSKIGLIFHKTGPELLDDYIVERCFSPVHSALLGLTPDNDSLESTLSSLSDSKNYSLPSFIDQTDSHGCSPLAWAVVYAWPEAVRILLKFGADPHQQRHSLVGTSPLLHLVIARPTEENPDIEGSKGVPGYLEVVALLLGAGADINATDHEGWTPLHVAASWNLEDVIQLLASHAGAKLAWDAKTNDGATALDLSRGGGGNDRVDSMLLHKAANGRPQSA